MLTYRWRRRVQELMFSWLVNSPFAILHVILWMIGCHTDTNHYMVLMNAIYDMSQSVVVFPVPDESSATLASYFMQYFLIKFGLCHLVVLCAVSPFKGYFISMCEALNLNHDVLVIFNHKGLIVDHFNRFLK